MSIQHCQYTVQHLVHSNKTIILYRMHRNFKHPSKYHPILSLFNCLQPEILPHLRHTIHILVFLDENFNENCYQIVWQFLQENRNSTKILSFLNLKQLFQHRINIPNFLFSLYSFILLIDEILPEKVHLTLKWLSSFIHNKEAKKCLENQHWYLPA